MSPPKQQTAAPEVTPKTSPSLQPMRSDQGVSPDGSEDEGSEVQKLRKENRMLRKQLVDNYFAEIDEHCARIDATIRMSDQALERSNKQIAYSEQVLADSIAYRKARGIK